MTMSPAWSRSSCEEAGPWCCKLITVRLTTGMIDRAVKMSIYMVSCLMLISVLTDGWTPWEIALTNSPQADPQSAEAAPQPSEAHTKVLTMVQEAKEREERDAEVPLRRDEVVWFGVVVAYSDRLVFQERAKNAQAEMSISGRRQSMSVNKDEKKSSLMPENLGALWKGIKRNISKRFH